MLTKKELLEQEGSTFPGKTYVECLLKPVFIDQYKHLFSTMFQVHRAHVIMLFEQKIIDLTDLKEILHALDTVEKYDSSHFQYDPKFEDLFFLVEEKITNLIGRDLAGNMHIAKSRNDMGVTMYRLVLRDKILPLLQDLILLREVLLDLADEHVDTIMPAYTHTQPAQPTTFGHYLLAVHDLLARDTRRLWSAFHQINQSPMGAAAITTTGFEIHRERVGELLGFDDIIENSYDAVAGADYLMELASAIIVGMNNMGRWIQDLLLLCTREFRAIRIADPYVQISSIMPQKRNPVSIEHSRSLASSAVADAQSVLTMIHNTPFGDIVDTEDDLQPHLYEALAKSHRVIKLMTVVLRTMDLDKEHLYQRAREGSITITELADMLCREKGIGFRVAHMIASRIAKKVGDLNQEFYQLHPSVIEEMIFEVTGKQISFTQEDLQKVVDPRYFVQVRQCRGGPSAEETKRMIVVRKQKLMAAWELYHQRSKTVSNAHLQLTKQIGKLNL